MIKDLAILSSVCFYQVMWHVFSVCTVFKLATFSACFVFILASAWTIDEHLTTSTLFRGMIGVLQIVFGVLQ